MSQTGKDLSTCQPAAIDSRTYIPSDKVFQPVHLDTCGFIGRHDQLFFIDSKPVRQE